MEVIGGKPDLKKLAKAGRIKLKPDGDVEGQTVNPVLYVDKKEIKHESGIVIGTLEIPVNGGHAHLEGSVWRVAFNGPKKYHEKVLKDEKRKIMQGEHGFRPSAPELTEPEFDEYVQYKSFLKEKGVTIAENEEFYAWLKKPKVGRPPREVEPS
jgi:hypothetical protein